MILVNRYARKDLCHALGERFHIVLVQVSDSQPAAEMPMGPILPDGGRVCVIGAGVSGLSAAWLLQTQSNSRYQVTLLEKDVRLGGHAYTVEILPGVKVDLGFQVGTQLYPRSRCLLGCIPFMVFT